LLGDDSPSLEIFEHRSHGVAGQHQISLRRPQLADRFLWL
jgi:hypothetical protein